MKSNIEYLWARFVEFISMKKENISAFNVPRPAYIAKITFSDRIINQVILRFVPNFIRPNYFTMFRFVMMPVILIFVFLGWNVTALILFVITAFTDAIDGALARTRNQITDWGIVFDPMADKLLIGIVGVVVVAKYISPYLASTIFILELCLVGFSYIRFKGQVVPAKMAGKIKMILQCFGVGFVMLFMATGVPVLLPIATYILYGAVIFALLSLTVYRSI
jgi:CDP-diacylglycerol--glycerol-3-phosphate 3-phosphatidyltransferase